MAGSQLFPDSRKKWVAYEAVVLGIVIRTVNFFPLVL